MWMTSSGRRLSPDGSHLQIADARDPNADGAHGLRVLGEVDPEAPFAVRQVSSEC
jgi:hypothetical protein